VIGTLVVLNMLVYTIECVLASSPHLVDGLYPSWPPPTAAPTANPGDDVGPGSPAFRVLDIMFAVVFTMLAALYVVLAVSIYSTWRDQAWTDKSLCTLIRCFVDIQSIRSFAQHPFCILLSLQSHHSFLFEFCFRCLLCSPQ
jgi:hypothetical protein